MAGNLWTAPTKTVTVATTAEMQNLIPQYLADGFTVTSQTQEITTLRKQRSVAKEILITAVLLCLCLIPGIVYFFYASKNSDAIQNVVVRVDPTSAQSLPTPLSPDGIAGIRLSDDRRCWWDGTAWIDCALTVPPQAKLSEDAKSWWDGQDWRPVPASEASPADPL
jgi:hypothetical protein